MGRENPKLRYLMRSVLNPKKALTCGFKMIAFVKAGGLGPEVIAGRMKRMV